MGAPLNFQNLFELDINPGGTASYVRLGAGIVSATPSNNETVDTKSYYNSDGAASSETTGFQYTWAFSGDKIIGDPAQDFIFSKLFSMGSGRKTNLRITGADGTVITGGVTIGNIVDGGGDANGTSAISFDIMFNGKPTLTVPQTATALSAVIAAGSVSGTTKATATPGASNRLAYKLATSLTTPKNREYIADFVEYTSAANIYAAAGQVLHVYELDTFNHLVKFYSKTLAGGDIMA